MLNRFIAAALGVSNSPINKYWKGTPYHDCERLGITIHKPVVQPGQTYLQAVVVHLLTPEENGGRVGNHNEYFDVIGEDDKRLNNSLIRGINNNIHLAARIDKPPNEFGTNFAVHAQDTIDAWVAEVPNIGPVVSDVVKGFNTRWGGEIVHGQAYGHISIYVIWKVIKDVPPEPPNPEPEPPTGDCSELQGKVDDAIVLMEAALKKLKEGAS